MGTSTPLTVPGARSAFAVEIGPVRSKSNFRRAGAAAGREWRALRDWEAATATVLRAARPDDWELADGELTVARRPAVIAVVFARTLLDAGNLSKSLLDAAQGVLYTTDASVRAVAEVAERARNAQGATVGFAQMDAGTPPAAVAAALSGLLAEVVERAAAQTGAK